MGRPKGSRNRHKKASGIAADAFTAVDSSVYDADLLDPGPVPGEDSAPTDAGGLEEHVATRDYIAQPATDDELAEMADQIDDIILERTTKDAELKSISTKYRDEIRVLLARESYVSAERRKAREKEEFDYEIGVVNVFDRRTGKLIRSRPLALEESQQTLPLDHPTKPPMSAPDPSSYDADADEEVEVEA